MLPNEDINSIAYQFQPHRLKLARELRGLKKSELAQRIGKTPSAISQFELNKARPDTETVVRLGLALRVPPAFFAIKEVHKPINIDECHFRSLRSASQRERKQMLAVGTMLSDLVTTLEKHVMLPIIDIPDCEHAPDTISDIEEIADSARRQWGLGLGPIGNMITLVESKGIVTCPIVSDSEKLDAFSCWSHSRPYIFLSFNKDSTGRSRFDVTHELGHLIMHPDVIPGDANLERQANRFASAFLMPRESFGSECPRRLNIPHFIELKRRWRVSLAAMFRRAYDLAFFSEATYRRACMLLNQPGYRPEPAEPARELPTIVRRAIEVALHEVPYAALAMEAGIPEVDLDDILKLVSFRD